MRSLSEREKAQKNLDENLATVHGLMQENNSWMAKLHSAIAYLCDGKHIFSFTDSDLPAGLVGNQLQESKQLLGTRHEVFFFRIK